MARKRMFDSEIINQDSFYDLPMEAKALYFLLGMEADDEGFVSPKKVLRLYGGTEDSIRILIVKKYIIPFSSGVIVITDWKRNNYLDKNRIKETIYLEEKSALSYNETSQKYELNENAANLVIPSVKQSFNECLTSIEENSIEENSIIKSSAKAQDNIIIDLPTNKFNTEKQCYLVTETFYETMCEIYPNVNVKEELNKMKGWLLTNKSKRKTLGGMEKFINSWLSKNQNQSGKGERGNGSVKKPDGSEFAEFS